jgi:hypothetical protein
MEYNEHIYLYTWYIHNDLVNLLGIFGNTRTPIADLPHDARCMWQCKQPTAHALLTKRPGPGWRSISCDQIIHLLRSYHASPPPAKHATRCRRAWRKRIRRVVLARDICICHGRRERDRPRQAHACTPTPAAWRGLGRRRKETKEAVTAMSLLS